MGRRQYPWVLMDVPWSNCQEYTRGTHYGLPLLSWNTAPKHLLATRRQLAAMGLRPNGQEPVAYLYFRCRRALKVVFAELFLISDAAPKRTATPAQHTAIAKAKPGPPHLRRLSPRPRLHPGPGVGQAVRTVLGRLP